MRPVEFERFLGDHQPRPEGEAVREPVRLVCDDAAKDEFARAEKETVADLEPGAGQELPFGERARRAVGRGEERRRIAAALDREQRRRAG